MSRTLILCNQRASKELYDKVKSQKQIQQQNMLQTRSMLIFRLTPEPIFKYKLEISLKVFHTHMFEKVKLPKGSCF